MRLLVISPAGYMDYAQPMIRSAGKVGIEPLIYGLNCSHPHGKDYQGTEMVKMLLEHSEAEYVMCVDAYDVAFVAREDEILGKLERFQYPMVVSAEREGVSGLRMTKEKLYQMCMDEGGYHAQLNIGGWIGERDYALDCFNEAERLYKDLGRWKDEPWYAETAGYSYDNHFQWMCLMKAWGHGLPFHIDTKCEIFQSMNQADVDVVEKRVFNRVTKTWPAVLHYNGDKTYQTFRKMVDYLCQ